MSQDPFQEREAEKYANPIPSREFILEHLTKREKPASRDELAVELHIEGEEQLEGLRRRLRAMERDGQLVFTRRQCYALPERLDLVKGTVIGHRDGYGFLRVEGRKDDLYLSSEQMKTCIHGDQVLAQPLGADGFDGVPPSVEIAKNPVYSAGTDRRDSLVCKRSGIAAIREDKHFCSKAPLPAKLLCQFLERIASGNIDVIFTKDRSNGIQIVAQPHTRKLIFMGSDICTAAKKPLLFRATPDKAHSASGAVFQKMAVDVQQRHRTACVVACPRTDQSSVIMGCQNDAFFCAVSSLHRSKNIMGGVGEGMLAQLQMHSFPIGTHKLHCIPNTNDKDRNLPHRQIIRAHLHRDKLLVFVPFPVVDLNDRGTRIHSGAYLDIFFTEISAV